MRSAKLQAHWATAGSRSTKLCTALRVVVGGEGTAVALDDAVTDGQPQARAFADWFGGEKRLKNPGHHLGFDAWAVIV